MKTATVNTTIQASEFLTSADARNKVKAHLVDKLAAVLLKDIILPSPRMHSGYSSTNPSGRQVAEFALTIKYEQLDD